MSAPFWILRVSSLSEDLKIKCECGAVQGTLRNTPMGHRLVCMCLSCQDFAKFLGRAKLLDAHGGTDLYQVTPAQLTISDGKEEIRSIRLSDSGSWRWYADCCKTPLGNTMASTKVPFLGLPTICLDTDLGALPIISAKIHGRCATTPCVGSHPAAPVKLLFHSLGRLIVNGLLGRSSPSPFVCDGRPLVDPVVLDEPQRKVLGLAAKLPSR